MAELTPADRVVALLEWGDITEADGEIDEAADGPGDWQTALWRAMRALMEGRVEAAERLAATATERGEQAGDPLAAALATILVMACRRDQVRLAEAESGLRALAESHPSVPASAHALLAVLVGEMGRDALARQELSRLLPREPVAATGRLATFWLLAELAVSIGAPPDDLDLLYRRLAPHAGDCAVEERGAVFYGSVSYALGRLAQARGQRDKAIDHYGAAVEAHERAGAVLLLAHTQRHLAALLRTRGEPGDWERAVGLLTTAVNIYRHLGIDGLAAETAGVLARSEDGLGPLDEVGAGDSPQFRRDGDGWLVGPADEPSRLRDAKGMRDIARLLSSPRASIHVADLLLGSASTAAAVAPGQPWSTMAASPWSITATVLDAETRHEYESRLTELAGELVGARWDRDNVRVALAKVERDILHAALDEGAAAASDPVELARRTVGARIRVSLDRIEQAQPVLGRHLRTSIRTGTFCSYEPERPLRWAL